MTKVYVFIVCLYCYNGNVSFDATNNERQCSVYNENKISMICL